MERASSKVPSRHPIDGIGRKKVGRGYFYFYWKNKAPVSEEDLRRIYKLKIPPAWLDVWITIDKKAPIQATGFDAKGRKQYRYHEAHIQKAEREKFKRLLDFLKRLPVLEKKLTKHQTLSLYHKKRVISTMLRIVREVHMRVGKECYAKTNKSYGVSSLRKTHVKIKGTKIFFRFKAKAGKRVSYSLDDLALAKHLKLLLKLEGDRLFQYIGDGKVKRVSDSEINAYIQTYMGKEFTCKDFRTYAANYLFLRTLLRETAKRNPKTDKIKKKNILAAVRSTARELRHTKAISKKSYIMSFCIDLYWSNPSFFLTRKEKDPNQVLVDLLTLYKKKVLRI